MLYLIFMIVQEREFRNPTQQACLLRIIVEYFVVGSDNKELKILNHYGLLDDSIRELINYKEFEQNEKNKEDALVDWLYSLQ